MVNDNVVNFLKSEKTGKDKIYEARKGIYEIQNLYSYIDSVYILRNDDTYVSSGIGDYYIDLTSLERSEIFAARGSTLISINGNGSIKKNGGKPFLTMSRAIYDINSQKLLGILVMNISSSVFNDALSVQNCSGICILDSKGTLLCGNEETSTLYNSYYNKATVVHKNITIDGKQKTLSGALSVSPLVVFCESSENVESLPRDILFALLMTLTAFILSGLVCAWFITVNIARPIRNLGEAMAETRSSGWLKKIDTEMPNNEIGRLAENYNSMIEYLNELLPHLPLNR